MKQKAKRFLAMFLAVIMVVLLVPVTSGHSTAYAETTIDYQNVGNSCRHILVKVAQLVYDPQIHNNITENGKPIGKTDAVEMLSSYFSYTLKGKHNKYLRDYSQAANDLANKLTHDTSATRRDMLITVSAIINLIYLVGTLSNKFNQDLI